MIPALDVIQKRLSDSQTRRTSSNRSRRKSHLNKEKSTTGSLRMINIKTGEVKNELRLVSRKQLTERCRVDMWQYIHTQLFSHWSLREQYTQTILTLTWARYLTTNNFNRYCYISNHHSQRNSFKISSVHDISQFMTISAYVIGWECGVSSAQHHPEFDLKGAYRTTPIS